MRVADALLCSVHARLGGGIDIQTFSNGTVEARWKRLYDGKPSDERYASAGSLEDILRAILRREDEADAAYAAEERPVVELVLAIIGAVTVVLAVAVVCFMTVAAVRDRITYGEWWWDETADGLESGRWARTSAIRRRPRKRRTTSSG